MVTTEEAVNATKVLYADVNGKNHCSVAPTGYPGLDSWMGTWSNAEKEPHMYTTILKSIVVPVPGLSK